MLGILASSAAIIVALIVFYVVGMRWARMEPLLPGRKPAPLPPGAFYPSFGSIPISWWRCQHGHAWLGGLEDPTHECPDCLFAQGWTDPKLDEPTTWTRVTSALDAYAEIAKIESPSFAAERMADRGHR